MILILKRFLASEKSGGLILIVCTAISLILANSVIHNEYTQMWHFEIGGFTIEQWINDALMTVFFLLIGLELEREIHIGELSNLKNALFPVAAALGGIFVPACIYAVFNCGSPTIAGIGIPTATDIAFSLGILSLLGNRVLPPLKIFLVALAIVDDLGAIIIISVYYTQSLVFTNLLIALGIFAVLLVLNRLRVYSLVPYLIGGAVMWYFMHNSGVHATITGVMLAFAIPLVKLDNTHKKSPSHDLSHFLHYPVTFFVLPLFALANTAIPFSGSFGDIAMQPCSIGIFTGLVIGKPLGIVAFSFIAVKLGLCSRLRFFKWHQIIGVSFLGGIGFTMSIFITLLAFDDVEVINAAKLTILVSSCIAAVIGLVMLNIVLKQFKQEHN